MKCLTYLAFTISVKKSVINFDETIGQIKLFVTGQNSMKRGGNWPSTICYDIRLLKLSLMNLTIILINRLYKLIQLFSRTIELNINEPVS